MSENTYLKALWVTIVVQVAGRALDLRWHATHDEFEGVPQQIEAHRLAWLGIATTLIVSAVAVRRLERANLGWVLTLASAVMYVPVATWHFIEHANMNDPEVAHLLLTITQAGMLTGAVLTAMSFRQRRDRPAP